MEKSLIARRRFGMYLAPPLTPQLRRHFEQLSPALSRSRAGSLRSPGMNKRTSSLRQDGDYVRHSSAPTSSDVRYFDVLIFFFDEFYIIIVISMLLKLSTLLSKTFFRQSISHIGLVFVDS